MMMVVVVMVMVMVMVMVTVMVMVMVMVLVLVVKKKKEEEEEEEEEEEDTFLVVYVSFIRQSIKFFNKGLLKVYIYIYQNCGVVNWKHFITFSIGFH
jgi:flagellar basal body-associated protein FliL